jgi:hypothetical protein
MYVGDNRTGIKLLGAQFYNKNRFAKAGVDVKITIFCDFRQFSAKKMAFSQKPML